MAWGSGVRAPTHRYVEVDVTLVKGHRGGVEARGLDGDGPGKQEKDDKGGDHEADEDGQEHEKLPVGKKAGSGVEEGTSLNATDPWAERDSPLPRPLSTLGRRGRDSCPRDP